MTKVQHPQLCSPRRMCIQELLNAIENKNSEPYVRIMACLVSIRSASTSLILDDGTGVVSIHSNNLPIKGAVGQTIDVLATLRDNYTYHATTIIWNISPQQETLRSLEVAYNDGPKILGYPCPPIETRDVLRMIRHADGATLEDLSLVLDVEPERVQKLLQQLQLEGEIYCNRQGAYVPL